MYDGESVLVVDYEAAGIFLKRSAIPQEHAGHRAPVGRSVGNGEVLGYFHGSLMYSDLKEKKRLMNTYGEGVLVATVEQF